MKNESNDVRHFMELRRSIGSLDCNAPATGDFGVASEQLAGRLSTVAFIARGIPNDLALLPLLALLQESHVRYDGILVPALTRINTFSERPIIWKHGRGVSGLPLNGNQSVFPHVWRSGHAAALEISRMALELFFRPLEEHTTAKKLEAAFRSLLEAYRKVLVMTLDEVAELQDRIAWERAKYIDEIVVRTAEVSREKHQGDDNGKKSRNNRPQNQRVDQLCTYLKNNRANAPSLNQCVRDFCKKKKLPIDEALNLGRQAYRYRDLWE